MTFFPCDCAAGRRGPRAAVVVVVVVIVARSQKLMCTGGGVGGNRITSLFFFCKHVPVGRADATDPRPMEKFNDPRRRRGDPRPFSSPRPRCPKNADSFSHNFLSWFLPPVQRYSHSVVKQGSIFRVTTRKQLQGSCLHFSVSFKQQVKQYPAGVTR